MMVRIAMVAKVMVTRVGAILGVMKGMLMAMAGPVVLMVLAVLTVLTVVMMLM
jgi:hypothetical protein